MLSKKLDGLKNAEFALVDSAAHKFKLCYGITNFIRKSK